MENIRKPWHNLVLNDYPLSFSRYEFPVVEALHVAWPSRYVSTIEQYFISLMLDNSSKHFEESLFGIVQRQFSACICPEKSGLKMHGLLDAHFR